MKIKSSKYVFCLALICALSLTGCAGNNRPKLSPDKDLKAEKKAAVAAYLNKLAVVGCDGDKVKPVGSLKEYREKMLDRYGRLLDSHDYKGEKKIFDRCSSVDAMDRFFGVFWSIRDPDVNTSENENKQLIDKRISEIESEILFKDPEVPGTSFTHNGGLRGDMAHVYMFRGNTRYKVKMEGNRLSDLMAWVYFDENQRPVNVFLFYNKGFGFKLFRHYVNNDSVESLRDALRELAKTYPTSDEDFDLLYRELLENDAEYIFRFAISRFSYYGDISLDKVLAPPTPESMTAKAIQPKILGVPNIPKDVKMIMSEYFVKVTGFSRLTRSPSGEYGLVLTVSIAGIDWKEVGEKLESGFDITISVMNERTREKKYFISGLSFNISADKYSKSYVPISLDNIKNHADGLEGTTLSDLFKTLAPGDYEVKIFLLNQITFKSGIWYEYISIGK